MGIEIAIQNSIVGMCGIVPIIIYDLIVPKWEATVFFFKKAAGIATIDERIMWERFQRIGENALKIIYKTWEEFPFSDGWNRIGEKAFSF